jgi:diamine N-acetyltransferase
MRYFTPTLDDAAALADCGAKLFVETFGHLYSKKNLTRFLAESHSVEAVSAQLADAAVAYRAVEDAGLMIAYCKVGPLSVPAKGAAAAACELKQLYVHKPFHGQGIAPILMQWALRTARARQSEEMYLSVWQQNARAQAFYKRYGFEVVGAFHFMVGDHKDEEFIMRLKLKDAA